MFVTKERLIYWYRQIFVFLFFVFIIFFYLLILLPILTGFAWICVLTDSMRADATIVLRVFEFGMFAIKPVPFGIHWMSMTNKTDMQLENRM